MKRLSEKDVCATILSIKNSGNVSYQIVKIEITDTLNGNSEEQTIHLPNLLQVRSSITRRLCEYVDKVNHKIDADGLKDSLIGKVFTLGE